jgi:hypothetical protein
VFFPDFFGWGSHPQISRFSLSNESSIKFTPMIIIKRKTKQKKEKI